RCNIKGPKVKLDIIRGQMEEYNKTPNVIWDTEMIKKYGPICGYYIGAKAVILVADPVLARHIQQGHANIYQERPRRVPGGINPDPIRSKMLGNLPVPEWRELRSILSKNFSSKRIKGITPTICQLIDELMNKITVATNNNKESVELNIYPIFQNLTFQMISQTGFSVHVNFSDDNELKASIEEEFSKSATSFWTKVCLCFPQSTILQHLRKYFNKSTNSSKLQNLCENIVMNRLNARERKDDILQVMLDSEIDDKEKLQANSMLFYEAAYETLSASLAFTMHLLTINENAQKKVREELSDYLKENYGQIRPENILQLKYLDAVIKESLRIYPPQTTFISRSGEEDFVYEKDGKYICTIPKKVQVQIALYQMHHSPEFWVDPERFIPERHLDETKSSAPSERDEGCASAIDMRNSY
ncbi:Cytochrome P450 3A21, partial [Pseudolycoriella hygida]